MGVEIFRARFRVAGAICLAVGLLLGLRHAKADDKPPQTWVNVTDGVGGGKWGYAGVTTMAAVPGSDDVIAGVSEAGLWITSDRGKTWRKLGEADAVQIQHRPYQILFDPQNPKIFWESGNYNGPGVFKTVDAGQTFQPLGEVIGVDGLGVDFSDVDRKTLVIGHHEQSRSVEKSIDGGKTWQKIGGSLPEHVNFSSDLIVFDAKTFVVNAAGWKQENGKQLPFGIYRTEDAGATWQKVCDAGPSGAACVTADGTVYWQTLWDAGLVKSADRGKTWEKLPGPVKANPIDLGDGKLLAPVDKQLFTTADGGKTWEKIGPELPFKCNGVAFNPKTKSIYAWRSTEAKEDNVIVRWDLP